MGSTLWMVSPTIAHPRHIVAQKSVYHFSPPQRYTRHLWRRERIG